MYTTATTATGATNGNWDPRDTRMRCSICMWYSPKKDKMGRSADFGRCRRHAPTMSGFPEVYGIEWCGDHKFDDSKA